MGVFVLPNSLLIFLESHDTSKVLNKSKLYMFLILFKPTQTLCYPDSSFCLKYPCCTLDTRTWTLILGQKRVKDSYYAVCVTLAHVSMLGTFRQVGVSGNKSSLNTWIQILISYILNSCIPTHESLFLSLSR